MSLQVFDIRYCYYRLLASLLSQSAPLTSSSSVVSADGEDSEGGGPNRKARRQSSCDLGALERMCTIYVSFVKGWGPDYPNRPTIQDSPCWLEVLMLRALDLKELLVRYFTLDAPALGLAPGPGAAGGPVPGPMSLPGPGPGQVLRSASVASAPAPAATAFTVQSPVSLGAPVGTGSPPFIASSVPNHQQQQVPNCSSSTLFRPGV